MKKIFVFACAALLGLASCTKDLENRVGALENKEESTQQQIADLAEKLNKEVEDLKKLIEALEDNIYVTSVSEIKENDKVIGYTITLSNGQTLTISHDISDVTYDDATVTLILADGTELVLPRHAEFSLNISQCEFVVLASETVNVAYTITGATENTTVYAVADGGYSVKVVATDASSGNLAITAPSTITDGKVIVFAGDNKNAGMATISFTEGVVSISENKYTVSKNGGNIEIPVSTNYSYEVVIPGDASWLTYVETKAMRNETLVLKAAANTEYARNATVTIKSGDKTWCTFEVVQEGAITVAVTTETLIGNWTVSYLNGAGSELSFTMPIEASGDASKGNLVLKRWFNQQKQFQEETIYATFDADAMTLSIASDQKISGSYGDPGKAKDAKGNWLDPIVFTVSSDGKTLSIDSKVQFGTYYMSQFTSFGDNYSLTKQE